MAANHKTVLIEILKSDLNGDYAIAVNHQRVTNSKFFDRAQPSTVMRSFEVDRGELLHAIAERR